MSRAIARLGLVGLALGLACDPPRTPVSGPVFPAGVRAVETLAAPSQGPQTLAPARPLLVEDWHGGTTEGWTPTRDLARLDRAAEPLIRVIEADADGPARVVIGTQGAGFRRTPHLFREIPATTGQVLRVHTRVRTQDLQTPSSVRGGAGLVISERDAEGKVLRWRDDLPRFSGSQPEWLPIETVFRVGPDTQQLRLELRGAEGSMRGLAEFDTVEVTQISAAEQIRRTRPLSPHRQAAAMQHLHSTTLGDLTQPALLAEAGTVWTMAVERRQPAQLRFAVGVDPRSAGETCLEVRAQHKRWALWSDCLSPADAEDRSWTEVEISLPPDPEGPTELRFIAQASEGSADQRGTAWWGNPRVVGDAAQPIAAPDVVLIVVDTLRADALQGWGQSLETTPQLSRFLDQSVAYTQAFSPSSWTAPSLGSVLTSRSPGHHGAGLRRKRLYKPASLRGNQKAHKRVDFLPLTQAIQTLPEQLRAAGYDTIGWSANSFFGPNFGFARGFDRYQDYRDDYLLGGRLLLELAAPLLDQRSERRAPQYLSLHMLDPHHPYRVRDHLPAPFDDPGALAPFMERQDNGAFQGWVIRDISGDALDHPDELHRVYKAEVRWVDEILGELLPRISPETLVVLLSDHGEHFGEHDLFIHGNSVYEELLHVPLIVRYPGGAHGGTTVDSPVSLLDVAPTILQQAGLPIPSAAEGQVLPTQAGAPADRTLYAEAMYKGQDRWAVRDQGWKLALTAPAGWQPGRASRKNAPAPTAWTTELFDLQADPLEAQDVSSAQPERLAALMGLARGHMEATLPGLHVRCDPRPSARSVTVLTTAPIARVLPVQVDPAVQLSLDPSDHAATAELGARSAKGHPDWWVVQTTRTSELVFSGPDGTALDPAGLGCTHWRAGPVEFEGVELDPATVEALQGIGYLSD